MLDANKAIKITKYHRLCLLYCHKCAAKYPQNEEAYKYEAAVHPNDIKLIPSKILNNRPVPVTYCQHCGNLGARIYAVAPIPQEMQKQTFAEKQEQIADQLKISKKELQQKIEKNQADYANMFGTDALKKDFLQPYGADGKPNKEFAEAYPDKRGLHYTQKELVDMGYIGEVSIKDREVEDNDTNGQIITKLN